MKESRVHRTDCEAQQDAFRTELVVATGLLSTGAGRSDHEIAPPTRSRGDDSDGDGGVGMGTGARCWGLFAYL